MKFSSLKLQSKLTVDGQELGTVAKPFWLINHNLYLVTQTRGSSIVLMNERTAIPLVSKE